MVHYRDGIIDRIDTGGPDAAELAIMGWRLDPRTEKIVRQVSDLPAEVVYGAPGEPSFSPWDARCISR